jgi:hypothetical protein
VQKLGSRVQSVNAHSYQDYKNRSFIEMKLLSHPMKLLHLTTLPSQQFCLCNILFNVHETLMKHALSAIVDLSADKFRRFEAGTCCGFVVRSRSS